MGELGQNPDTTYNINWSEIKDPQDTRFREWCREKYSEFVSQYGSKQDDFDTINADDLNRYRFNLGLLKYLEENNADWSLIVATIENVATAKRRVVEDGPALSMGKNDKKIVEQLVGQTVDNVLENEEMDWDVVRRFDVHGLSKGDQLSRLQSLLEEGIDRTKAFYTSNFIPPSYGHGANMGGGDYGPYTTGGFLVVSSIDKMLSEGIGMVIVNWQYREAAPLLAKKYSNIIFATPEGMKNAFAHLANKES